MDGLAFIVGGGLGRTGLRFNPPVKILANPEASVKRYLYK
jgi:hypothetical protein